MKLTSEAFSEGAMIPPKYTCDGADPSPPLQWEQTPEGTRGFALICDDPDAPVGNWVHWVYYDIPADVESLPEGVRSVERPATGGVHGKNDFRRLGYGGPCPPGGTHRYYFTLYALDAVVDLPAGAAKKALLDAMEGHVLDQTRLMGRYKR